jgi:hypothetical protein
MSYCPLPRTRKLREAAQSLVGNVGLTANDDALNAVPTDLLAATTSRIGP